MKGIIYVCIIDFFMYSMMLLNVYTLTAAFIWHVINCILASNCSPYIECTILNLIVQFNCTLVRNVAKLHELTSFFNVISIVL